MEATAEWAAGIAEANSAYDDPNPMPPQSASRIDDLFTYPSSGLDDEAIDNLQYGRFMLADYIARNLGVGAAAIRETWEDIRAQGSTGSAMTAISDVAISDGATLAGLLDGFARANWEQNYTATWSQWLTSTPTLSDDLGPARPARDRRDFVNGEVESGTVLIGQGGSCYLELVPPAGGLGVLNISVTGIYGAGVDAQLLTYSTYSPPTLPTVCTATTISLSETGTKLISTQVPPGCRYVAVIFTSVAFSGDSFREFGWTASYSPALVHDTFSRADRVDGSGWGMADSGQTWVANDQFQGQNGKDIPFTLGGIAGGQAFIDIPGTAGCCTYSSVASIRLPVFGNSDLLMLAHFADVTGPHSPANATGFEVDVASSGNGADLSGQFSTGNPRPSGWTHVNTLYPFYIRAHIDWTNAIMGYKVWDATAAEPENWTLWWLVDPASHVAPLEIRTDDFGGTGDFARLYVDQIDVWGQ